jgi:uncharacterized protein YhjY with autotransporter beta-barrel domain
MKRTKRSSVLVRKLGRSVGTALLTATAATAGAQGLPSIPGLTELQSPVAVTFQSVCIAINGAAIADPNGTLIQRLGDSCTKMVASALNNQPGGNPFPPQFNLMISDEQLRTGIQAIAPVQANAQKQISTEASKMNLIAARLLTVRGGSRGVVLGVNGHEAAVAGVRTGARDPAGVARGGGASADEALGGRLGAFVNIAYNWGSIDRTTLQDAYDYGSFSILAGADYRVSDAFVLGGALGYSDTRSDFDRGLGKVDAATTSIVGYGTWYADDWYVDGFASYARVDYDSTRNIDIPSNAPGIAAPIATSATSSPAGDQWSLGIGVGREFRVGNHSVTPTARLGYIRVKNKAFAENEPVAGLGLAVNERTVRSLQSALGVRLAGTVNTATAVLGPYLTAQWLHEFENNSPSIVSKYVADPTNQFFAIPTAGPTRDYAILSVGTSATFPNDLSGFVQLSAALGLHDESSYGLVLGLRKQF